MKCRNLVLALLLVSVAGARLAADDEHHHGSGSHDEMEQFGKVSFPTSCSAAVQKEFERAVALLHSFWYEESERQFATVGKKDPACAIAHWGVAMSLYHPLWERPDAEALKGGRAAIEKAKALGAKTDREREYLTALATFYANSEKRDHAARATSYAQAMEQLYRHHPEDREAAVFYALSLLGAEPPHDPSLENRKKAAGVLEKVFAEDPDHPGVAHYLIHTYDTPQLAPLGVNAARRYAKIAPSSPHALHMPSHIFTRLGLWQESIHSNLASVAATRRATEMHMGGAAHQLHALDFLEYAYLQEGREAEVRRLLDEIKGMPDMEHSEMPYTRAMLPARCALELHHWSEAAALTSPLNTRASARTITYWARAIGAARSGNTAQARQDVETLRAIHGAAFGDDLNYKLDDVDLTVQEAVAWLTFAEGRKEEALAALRAAADQEDARGPDSLAMPAREMLGDMLLDAERPGEALTAYETSLKEAPNRFDSLYGAARAAERAGNAERARTYYAQLAAVAGHAGQPSAGERPEVQQARVFLAR